MPKSLSATLAVLILLLSCPQAHPFSVSLSQGDSGGVLHWDSPNLTYHLHPSCSDDLPTNTCLNELRASFDAWKGVDCSSATFTEMGTSNSLASTALGYNTNGMNEVAFIETEAWVFGVNVLGVAGPTFYLDGEIIEADIVFNGYWHTWSTSGQAYSTDVRNVAVHEVGHYFGLGHVLEGQYEANPPTMAPSADPFMATRTPEADDHAGLCFLYPSSSWSCSNNSHCPLVTATGQQGEYYAGQLQCTNGGCDGYSSEVTGGDSQLGETCTGDASCAGDSFCQPLEGAGALCSKACVPSSFQGCDPGFICFPYANYEDLGACLPTTLEGVGDVGVGGVCKSHTDCETGLCVLSEEEEDAHCYAPCESDLECGGGEVCTELDGVSFGACAAQPTPPATKLLGEPCDVGDECVSGLCAGAQFESFCSTPCDTHLQCPQGWICSPLADGGNACVGDGTTPEGSACLTSSECQAGLDCVDLLGNGQNRCHAPCGAGVSCGCGFSCLGAPNPTSAPGLWCAPGPKVGCVLDGETCDAHAQCVSGSCEAGVCRTPCSLGDAQTGCPLGTLCLRHDTSVATGFCTTPGALPVSSTCVQDANCQTLLCVDGRCAQPCDPAQSWTCSVNEFCSLYGVVSTCTPIPQSEPSGPQGNGGTQPPQYTAPGVPFQPTSPPQRPPSSGGCTGGPMAPGWLSTILVLGLWAIRARRYGV